MKLFAAVLVIWTTLFVSNFAAAQEPGEWVPQEVEALRQIASSKTEFTLDHSMLVLASKLDDNNEDLRRVIAGVSGVSVHRYHFQGQSSYDPEALRPLKQEYESAGWHQLMNKHDKHGGHGVSDLWIRFDHDAITSIAILLAKEDEVNFVVVSGSISPLDLSHLGGHFGIPKIQGGVEIPNNRHDR